MNLLYYDNRFYFIYMLNIELIVKKIQRTII